MRRHWLAVLSVAVMGCSSGSDGKTTGAPHSCALRKGTYVVTWRERSGNCGPVAEQIVNADQGAGTVSGQPNGCVDHTTGSADNCTVTLDVTCPVPATGGGTVTDRGKIEWADDASMGGGIIQIIGTGPDGANVCAETYDVTWIRQ